MELRPFITEPAAVLPAETTLGGGLNGRTRVRQSEISHVDEEVTEQPWHSHAAQYFALGLSGAGVAEACEVSEMTISRLLKASWFQERVTNLLSRDSKDVMEFVRAEAFASVVVIKQLRDDLKVAPTVRLAAAKDLADRYLGKPTQRVEMAGTVTSGDPVKEAERLEQENSRLRAAQP